METKVCKDCGEEFPLDNFRLLRQGVTKPIYESYCKPCAYVRKYDSTKRYRARGTVYKKTYRKNLIKQYGITVEEFDAMKEEQGGVCKICGSDGGKANNGGKKELAIDHCHETGKVRGLLCADCNTGLGKFKDNVELIQNAIEYLNT